MAAEPVSEWAHSADTAASARFDTGLDDHGLGDGCGAHADYEAMHTVAVDVAAAANTVVIVGELADPGCVVCHAVQGAAFDDDVAATAVVYNACWRHLLVHSQETKERLDFSRRSNDEIVVRHKPVEAVAVVVLHVCCYNAEMTAAAEYPSHYGTDFRTMKLAPLPGCKEGVVGVGLGLGTFCRIDWS